MQNRTPPSASTDPRAAHDVALARAADLLAAGRAAEATATLRAAEALARLSGLDAGHRRSANPEFVPPTGPDPTRRLAALAVELMGPYWKRLEELALSVLSDRGHVPSGLSPYAYRWRAETLGPEIAERDYLYGVAHGWGHQVWDEHGRLKPIPGEGDPTTAMWRQHLRCNGVDPIALRPDEGESAETRPAPT